MSASFLPSINGPAAPASAEVDVAQLMGDTLLRLINELPQGEGDQQGQISFNSFKAAVVSLGLATTEARRIFDHFDPDGTGFINFTELRSEVRDRRRDGCTPQGMDSHSLRVCACSCARS